MVFLSPSSWHSFVAVNTMSHVRYLDHACELDLEGFIESLLLVLRTRSAKRCGTTFPFHDDGFACVVDETLVILWFLSPGSGPVRNFLVAASPCDATDCGPLWRSATEVLER